MQNTWLDRIETPCIVIDMAVARRNIRAMQRAVEACGVALRPHIKTHKMPLFARMQVEAGALGISCAKVSEAEVMADGGIEDIFIAYPMVGDFRIRRAIALSRRVRRLILAVDSKTSADSLNLLAREAGVTLDVRLEIDTGAARTGASMEGSVSLACYVAGLPSLSLTGIYTFKGLVHQGKACLDARVAALEEGKMMAVVAERIRAAGVPILDVSAGSTPTGLAVAETGLVNEVRPGTYVFGDMLLVKEGAIQPEDIAGRFYTTVVSTPKPGYAVLDGGTKTFPMDIPIGVPPFNFPGYAIAEGSPNLQLDRMNEEHGMLTAASGATGLSVGQKIALLPIHICTAINMQNSVYLVEDEVLTQMPVEARGMLV